MSPSRDANRPLERLSVEDNAADQWLIADMLQKSKRKFNLSFVSDGEAAMRYLDESVTAKKPPPDFILLDLNLPRKDGFEVLQEIRKTEALKQIPVLILTTSEAEQDISKCMALGANLFIVKPAELDGFNEILQSIETYCETHLSPSPVRP